MVESKNTDAVPQETQEEEMDRLKLEIQQCKDFIQTQQQLLQVRVNQPWGCVDLKAEICTERESVFNIYRCWVKGNIHLPKTGSEMSATCHVTLEWTTHLLLFVFCFINNQ